jgi:hypothetical protein
VNLPDGASLAAAREWLSSRLAKGGVCPCCRRWAKVNRYTIGSTATRALITLVRLSAQRPGEWIHSKEVSAAIAGVPADKMLACTGDGMTKLELWALVRSKPNDDDPNKRELGLRQPTQAGIDFVHGRLRVARWAEVYDNVLLRLDASETVNVRDTLKERFSYEELMSAVAGSTPDLAREVPPRT